MNTGHITFFIGQCPMSDGYFDPGYVQIHLILEVKFGDDP